MPYIEILQYDLDEINELEDIGISYTDLCNGSLAEEMKLESFIENRDRFTQVQFEEWIKTLSR